MKKFIVILSLISSFSAMADSSYKCFGTEPFWAMELTQDKLSFGLFEDDTVVEDVISRETAAGVGHEYVFVASTKTATATIVTGACNDGMSDEMYSHHVVYRNATSTLYGCCNVKLK